MNLFWWVGPRAIICLTGVGMIILAFICFTLRKMIVRMAMYWNVFGLFMIIVGLLPIWHNWKSRFDGVFFWPFVLIFYIMLVGMFALSMHVSADIYHMRELAMHISLLNQENEKVIRDIRHFKEVEKYGKEEAERLRQERARVKKGIYAEEDDV
ncbi:MAG: DUF2304 domain-containing protein [Eubacterium sp.]|nr:DUF2304 domain-containing protein [Eubacterium sp.]